MGNAWCRLIARSGKPRLLRPFEERGQVAVVFTVLLALVLLLAAMMGNLGQVARKKTATTNAADAAALAAASWVASGENELSMLAQGMAMNVWIVQFIFLIPFCFSICFSQPFIIWAALELTNVYYLGTEAAGLVSHGAWDMARMSGLFTAVQNAPIDAVGQENKDIRKRLADIGKDFSDNQNVPEMPIEFTWHRTGLDGQQVQKTLRINVDMQDSRPQLVKGTTAMTAWCWGNCWLGNCCVEVYGCVWPCFTGYGWNQSEDNEEDAEGGQSSQSTSVDGSTTASNSLMSGLGSYLGAAWSAVVGIIDMKSPISKCDDDWCIPYGPIVLPGIAVCGDHISDSTGHVQVTVTLETSGSNANLGFWTMRNPTVTSTARSRYSGVGVGGCYGLANPDAVAGLVEAS